MAAPASRLRRPLVLERLPHRGDRRPHYGLTFATLVVAVLAYSLMQSLVAPALLSIQHDVNTTTTTVTWLLTGYLLSACVATPILSRFGDMFGKRRMVIYVLFAFFVGTLVCALATSITQLIVGRVIQGAGGALFPLSVGIIRDEFPSRRVVTGVATLSGIIGTGSSIGIVLAGPITDYLSYHWLFWIPLVPIAAATAACFVVVPESPKRDRVPVDWLGGVLLAAWLVAILLAVSESTKWGWGSARIIGLFAAGALVSILWVAVEARTVHPLVDMQIMRMRAVWTSNAAAFLIGFGLFTGFVLIPQFAEAPTSTGYGFGASVTRGSLFLVPMSMAMLIVSLLVGKALARMGPRLPIAIGALLSGSPSPPSPSRTGSRGRSIWERRARPRHRQRLRVAREPGGRLGSGLAHERCNRNERDRPLRRRRVRRPGVCGCARGQRRGDRPPDRAWLRARVRACRGGRNVRCRVRARGAGAQPARLAQQSPPNSA